ncbi:uncharacterized protein LOC133183863 [Saccostrea echinata]|uniref:uncharacterized protein LOC133183863 n=1 Tax=Saccostrea echinata TaxID=191078 RepID=UPI002A8306E7|nr:uncharacterized protein LOC133183863 [Saccostrea echinata]
MATKQVATKASGVLAAAGKPKIFTDAKGRQFMVLKKTLQTPDYYLWRPKRLTPVKGMPTLSSTLRRTPVKDLVFGVNNTFFFRFASYWFVWVFLLFSWAPLVSLREKMKVSELPVKTAEWHHPLSWDMVKEKEEELKKLEGARYRL